MVEKYLMSSNIIVGNLLGSDNADPKIGHVHDFEKLEEFICSILPDKSKGVQSKKSIRMGNYTDDCVEP